MHWARCLSRRIEKGRAYGEITAKALAVLEALLWAFHNARALLPVLRGNRRGGPLRPLDRRGGHPGLGGQGNHDLGSEGPPFFIGVSSTVRREPPVSITTLRVPRPMSPAVRKSHTFTAGSSSRATRNFPTPKKFTLWNKMADGHPTTIARREINPARCAA
jgi:hypothetical protein